MSVLTHINPDTLHASPAYSQAIRVAAGADLIYVGGQNGVDADGKIVATDLASQSRTALANVQECLSAGGARIEDVIKFTVLIKEGERVEEGYAAFAEMWGQRPNPPVVTAAFVADLGVPGAKVEIDAIAAVPA